jgi:serine/threonine protein kinase
LVTFKRVEFKVSKNKIPDKVRVFQALNGQYHTIKLATFQIYEDIKRYCLILLYILYGKALFIIVNCSTIWLNSLKFDFSFYFQSFKAINYCHSKQIIHRNVKSGNILYDRKKYYTN